jgi:cholesterol transport system auxiliary component
MSGYFPIERRALLALLLGGALGGCVSGLTKPAPEKRQYVLTAARPTREPPAANGLVLLMRRFTIDPAYQDRGIVTRTDAVSMQSDFYNEFFIDPAQLVSGQISAWLAACGLFSEVVGPTSALAPTHVLEGHVVKLYGDLSGTPSAVLELQLLLLDVRAGANRVLLHPDFERREATAARDPAALVQGWNQGLSAILAEFEQSLRAAMR